MEIKQLITFKTAAENLNFTQTAKILNFAQSSVTAQIKSLESELGKPLFERLGKRLILTEDGRKFKLYADKMIMLNEEAKQAISGDKESAGSLIIGAPESQCTYRLPQILKEFKNQYPNVKVVFKPAYSDEKARKQLIEGAIDFAFIMDTSKPEDVLKVEKLIKEDFKMVASPDHPFITKKEIQSTDLIHETLLLTETGCSYRNLFEEMLSAEGVYPLNKIEFVSVEAIKQCVMVGLGIAVLPSMVVETELKMGKMTELAWKGFPSPVFTQIAWHKDKWMTPHLQAFIQLTRHTLN